MNFKKLFLFLFFCFLLSKQSFAQQPQPIHPSDSLQKFYSYEAGFITKSGCKVIPSAYYCLSEGRYYFAVGDKNYFYLDTAEVQQYQNIEIGKDQQFATKKRAGFNRRLWLGTVFAFGPSLVALGAGGIFLIGATAFNGPYDGGGFFVAGLGMCSAIFCKVLKTAIINVREHNAYKEAKPYVCS